LALRGSGVSTASHPGGPGRGAGWLTRMVEVHAGTPVVAIGGITPARVGEVMGAGAAGVAAIRGVWQATDPGAAVACYLEAMTGSDHE
ncbi:MAG: thiamine phosphate synthase, partial [Gemmatimonadota bacterium]|nr:thiamine phosphate synthase [Gemmatimonadota bacterium]